MNWLSIFKIVFTAIMNVITEVENALGNKSS